MTDPSKIAELREKFPELFKGVNVPEADKPVDPQPLEKSVEAAQPIEISPTVEALPTVASEPAETIDAPAPLANDHGAGYVVFWSVSGGADRAEVEAALANASDDIRGNFPAPPTPIAALQRARTQTAGRCGGIVFRAVAKGEVAIVSEKDGAIDGKRDYDHGVTVRVPVGTETGLQVKSFSETATDCLAAANELSATYSEAMGRVEAADLSAWLTACADDLGAVSLRPRGGVYFIPASKAQELAAIKAAASATGSAAVYTMALAGDADTAESVAQSTAEAFLGDFGTIDREISEWTTGLSDAKRPGRGFNALSSQLGKLKDRVYMYREVLSAQESRLSTAIAGAESALKATFEAFTTAKHDPAKSLSEAAEAGAKAGAEKRKAE